MQIKLANGFPLTVNSFRDIVSDCHLLPSFIQFTYRISALTSKQLISVKTNWV